MAAEVLEARELCGGLNPFRDDLQLKHAGEVKERGDDVAVAPRLSYPMCERPVELDRVEGQALEVAQG
jgi:hypothetical protein